MVQQAEQQALQQQFRYVGKRIPRVDIVSKLTGAAVFAEDVKVPGVLYGKLLHSPHPHARIVRIDTSRAEQLPGVRAVATAADLPDKRVGRVVKDEHYFARDKVRYVGDRVAAVAADTREIALEAVRRIEVEYELLPPVRDAFEGLAAGAPIIHEDLLRYTVVGPAKPQGGNLCSLNSLTRGEPEAAFGECARVFEQVYTTQMQHQTYLEPHACVAVYNPDRTYTIHTANQGQFPLRNAVAEVLGVPQNQVRVVPAEIGGGFGGKSIMKIEPAAAVLAKKAGRPVRIVMSRHEDFIGGNPRAAFHITLKTGVTADMRMHARTIDVVMDQGAHAMGAGAMAASVTQFAEGPYAIPNLRITSRLVYTNKACTSAMRAPGGPQINFALESETERICAAMGWDGIEFRRRNAMPTDYVNTAGGVNRSVFTLDTLEACLALSGYRHDRARLGPNRGRGLALGNWNVGGNASGAVIKMNGDGSVNVIGGVVDLSGVNTTMTQIVAEALDVPLERVTVKSLDTDSAPHATNSGGSQVLKSHGLACFKASEHIKAQLFELAVDELDASAERMELKGGQVRVQGEPSRAVAVTKLLSQAQGKTGPIVGYGATGNSPRMPSMAAHVADVEVDPETGQVKVVRYCAAQDVGLAINPMSVEGQIHGGVAQGLGQALCEQFTYRDGQPQNAGFLDYKIPSALDVPMIETTLVEKPSVAGPYGAKGVGEPPVVPVPAAIANAIYNAVGVRVTSLPITPEKLRQAIREQERGGGA
ncbi:MAG: xanthine dehydrogenase family protein molybdopterin-binding subunit [Candidatus Lambdaproteobacteria bacterium]|nr:xanthine dehydrogenase family protein molybdopterin-binding subunit [Candidatus Lambdaproteobacteria bacterium]